MSRLGHVTRGLVRENPVFVLALGLCPTLAVSSSIANAVGMGLATTFVLVSSNAIVSLIRGVTPQRIRIPIFITVIATFVTIADLVMHAYQPELHRNLGIFVPLIVVNCIILGRAEAFASRNRLGESLLDGLGMGVGFTLALLLLGTMRELIGAGQLLGYPVLPRDYEPVLIMILPPGAFFTLGIYLGLFNWIGRRRSARRTPE